MPFNIDTKQEAVRAEAKAFAEKEIVPVSEELDRMSEPRKFPSELYRKIGAAGFLGYAMPKMYGGQGKSHLEYVTLIEELSYADAAIALLCCVADFATSPIIRFGSDEQKNKYVPDCAVGKRVPAFALTEQNAGSDDAGLNTVAVKKGNEYVVNGEKAFIMHGDVADLAVLFCKVNGKSELSAFLVETDQAGWQKRTLKHKLGLRASTTGDIVLKDFKAPGDSLLGEIGKGSDYAKMAATGGRISVAAQGIGIAQRALDESIEYAKNRQAFGQPIAKLQAIQWMIADMATRLEAARLMTYNAAALQDKGGQFSMEAAQAKLYSTDTSHFCVDRAMQIHAGYGYIGEFSTIEKLYRDQRVLETHEGTSEVQRLVIARNVIGQ